MTSIAMRSALAETSGTFAWLRAVWLHTEPGTGGVGLEILPCTLCELRKGMRHPPNLKAVACVGSKGEPQ